MTRIAIKSLATMFLFTPAFVINAEPNPVPPSPNGIEFPKDYANWKLIGVSHRTDNNSLRAILGNYKAVKAARIGQTNPWPDGSILAKVVWQDSEHPNFPAATVPGSHVHTEFMVKDSKRFAATGGWGFARWLGADLKPFGDNPDFANDCFACHAPAQASDYVFTKPAKLP